MVITAALFALLLAAEGGGAPPAEGNGAPPAQGGGAPLTTVACANDPRITYVVSLPLNYSADRKWPVLFVFDPTKNGEYAAELFRETTNEYGWIMVSSNDTQSDVDPAPSSYAIREMWRDVPQRYSIDRDRVYASGFSGGAMFSWWFIKGTESAGVIGTGGRLAAPNDTDNVKFDWYGIAGSTDFNFIETKRIEAKLRNSNTKAAYRTEYFDGPHRWAPKEFLRRGVEWQELQAMRHGTRARDEQLIAKLLTEDVTRADRQSDPLVRMRHYEGIARTFDGLANVDPAKAKASELAKDPLVTKLTKDEKRASDMEWAARGKLQEVIAEFMTSPEAKSEGWLVRELNLPLLLDLAKETSYRGLAARRVLASTYANLHFYLPRELRARQKPKELEIVLGVARRIHPERK